MKMNSCVTLLVALGGLVAASNTDLTSSGNPIGRIVTLLNGLKDKLETDLTAESDLFETYKCWYKTTTTTKTASNDAAASRIDSMKTYIKDIDAGRIEFTTERQDLEKQVASLKKELEQAKAMRDQENKDFLAAETEMKQGVAALKSAIKTIEDGTKGSLAQTRSYIDMLSTRHSLQKSMAFARGFLGADDQKLLEQFITDDTPKPDWKKLNKKADHKMKYQKSSGKILGTLKKLETTFQGNLDDARKQEKEASASYVKLSGSKNSVLDTATKAMKDMTLEGGARGVSKAGAQNEVDALEAQVKADTKFISEAGAAFKTKEKEWDLRKEMRSKEVLAMSQAIAVLASDDAKDQFTKSFSLLQEVATVSEPKKRARCAARLVQSVSSKVSAPILALLSLATSNDAIKKVVVKIDEIVVMKGKEEKEDLEKKEKCESDLSEAASKSRKASLAIDTATEDITRASSQIAELLTQIKEQEEKKKGLQGQIVDLTNQRKNENSMYKIAKIDDVNAVKLVESAINLIKGWKTAKKFIQLGDSAVPKVAAPTAPEGILPAPAAKVSVATQAPHRMAATAIKVHTAKGSSAKQAPQFQVEAGAAPIPPPATWGAGAEYKGASEQGGIIGILGLVKDDMEMDLKSNDGDETQAVKDFNKEKTDLEGEIKASDTAIDAYTKDKAAKSKTVAEKTKERTTKAGELDGQVKLYKATKPGCDFLLVNFKLRVSARQTEVDGLKKAKAILKGAKFGKFMQVGC